jgi:hypothetical protein
MAAPRTSTRFITKLVDAAQLTPKKREVTLDSGEVVVFYVTPLTAAERAKAQKATRGDNVSGLALQLLIGKAMDENGTKLFTPGDEATLMHEVRDSDLQKLMLAVMGLDEDGEETLDMKSSSEGAE